MNEVGHVESDTSNVYQGPDGTWFVRLDGGLRVDTFFGLGRAVLKIPFDVRRVGGSYELVEQFTKDDHRWARIRHLKGER